MVKLLPLGSVVIIDTEKSEKILIVGRLVRKDIDSNVFDYCGVRAPLGLMFVGFQDEDELVYSSTITKQREDVKKNNTKD